MSFSRTQFGSTYAVGLACFRFNKCWRIFPLTNVRMQRFLIFILRVNVLKRVERWADIAGRVQTVQTEIDFSDIAIVCRVAIPQIYSRWQTPLRITHSDTSNVTIMH